MENQIKIKKKYLVFRDDARKIMPSTPKRFPRNGLKSAIFDFSQADFFSRSFADEFLNRTGELEKTGVKIKIRNLKPNLRQFIAAVKETKNKIKKTLSR